MQTEDIKDLSAALTKAQSEIEGAKKDSTNPHFKSKYADLASVWEACRGALTKNGINVTQPIRAFEGGMRLVTRLTHDTGQWVEDDGVPLMLGKQDMQGLGSALTYARRYGLMAMVGIAPEDDDGNTAVSGISSQPVAGKPAAAKTEAPNPRIEAAKQKALAWVGEMMDLVEAAASEEALSDAVETIHADAGKVEFVQKNMPDSWQRLTDVQTKAWTALTGELLEAG